MFQPSTMIEKERKRLNEREELGIQVAVIFVAEFTYRVRSSIILEGPAEMVWASGQDAFWMPPKGGVSDMSHREEASA